MSNWARTPLAAAAREPAIQTAMSRILNADTDFALAGRICSMNFKGDRSDRTRSCNP